MHRILRWTLAALLANTAMSVPADDIDAWWSAADRTQLRVELALDQLAVDPVCTLALDCRHRFTTTTYRRLQSAHAQAAVITVRAAATAIVETVLASLPVGVTVQTIHSPAADAMHSADGQLYLQLAPMGAAPVGGAGACRRDYLVSLSGKPAEDALVLSMDDPVQFERRLAEAVLGIMRQSGSMASGAFLLPGGESAGAAAVLLAGFDVGPAPDWAGNVKKLLIPAAVDSAAEVAALPAARYAPEVVDSTGGPALHTEGPRRGRLRERALSFWTHPGGVLPGLAPLVRAGADGEAVRRGGAGQNIPGYTAGASAAAPAPFLQPSRQLFTEASEELGVSSGAAPLLLLRANFDSASSLRASLQAADDAEALALLQWLLGWDVDEAPQRLRPWLLGPVFHSRPLALNYGATGAGYSASNPHIRIFFGSNDGILHVLENTDPAGRESGRELYGFIPRQFLATLASRRSGTVPGAPAYGVDGSPVALRVDHNGDGNIRGQDGDEAFVYVGLRRGGSRYYALDVTDPTQPPRLQWSIARTRGGDFDELGLTFSTPVVGRVRFGGRVRDVLVFGGGYYGGRDSTTGEALGKDAGAGDDPVGNALYLVDARTGELVWKAVYGATGSASNTQFAHSDMRDSIPADLAVLTDAGGIIHRVYAGDTGGRVWRVDLPPGATQDPDHRARHWFVSLFAELGAAGTGEHDRRFFHAPALVRSIDSSGVPVDGVLMTSGDRANPLGTRVKDYAFYLRDRLTLSGDARVRRRPSLGLEALAGHEACVPGAPRACDPEAGAGWKLALAASGEKGWGRPLVDGGRALFSSFTPRPSPCDPPPGQTTLYAVNLANGSPRNGQSAGIDGGFAMPAEMLRVGEYILLPAGGPQGDSSGTGLLRNQPVQRSLGPRLLQTYWRELGVDPL